MERSRQQYFKKIANNDNIILKSAERRDLPFFFEHQLDPMTHHMAAFTSWDPSDRHAFMTRWTRILGDDTIIKTTILFENEVAGHVACFERLGDSEVTYWIGKKYWGKGIATKALSAFLRDVQTRPLYARAARDNVASIRVLEKCGFKITGYEKAFARARGEEIEEVILRLDTV